MQEKPIFIQKNVIAKTALFTIEQIHLRFSNGAERVYERVRSNGHGAVLIAAITTTNTLILVREYAAGTHSYELGFPKGLIEKGESSLEAANRELREEVGVAAKKLTWLKTITLAPGYFGAHLDVIVARDLYSSPLPGDEPEPLERVEWPLNACDKLLANPDFSEARSIAALLLVKQWLEKEMNDE